MLNRRHALTTLAAAGLAGPAFAQQTPPSPDDGFGAPAATSPFPPAVFKARRDRLAAQLNGGVGLLYSAASFDTNTPTPSLSQQQPDFAYLTGILDEAGAALVLAPAERTYKEMLFLADRQVELERYEGARLSLNTTVRQRTGFERLRRTSGLGGTLAGLAERHGTLCFLGPRAGPGGEVPRSLELYNRIAARTPGVKIVNMAGLIAAMRVQKEPREVELIRKACAATDRGLAVAMRRARPGMKEKELKALIEAEFRAAGGTGLAFPSIVGAGRASAVLHYTGGEGTIRAGDLILCDVGASVDGYAADTTRTFPVDGRFTPDQRGVYETVLAAQTAAAAKLRAGTIYEDCQLAADEVIRRAGYIDDFWHGLGHFVGLEVHDAGDYAKPLPANAVITIEPGIYLPDRRIGVRIEDTYLVQQNSCESMSLAPKTVTAIEQAMASRG